ncbi:MAG: peptide deformylase [Cyanobacteria bacterium P01_A01_bin.123]
MAVRDILLLGNPQLYQVSGVVTESELESLQAVVVDLHDTLMAFRKQWGAGRAIAAPQIGVMKRLIYMHIDRPVVFINPVFEDQSEAMFEVWDDCMSFPELLVKVRRHQSCRIVYRDMTWQSQSMALDRDLSELLLHEADHLDGILAVSKAIDATSFALRNQQVFTDYDRSSLANRVSVS